MEQEQRSELHHTRSDMFIDLPGTRSQPEKSSLGSLERKVPVLGAPVAPLDLEGTVRLLMDMVQTRTSGYVCIANVHTATLALRDDRFRRALHNAALVVADGMPVIWRVRAAGYPQVGRVYGADLIEALCMAGISTGLRHGFLGGWNGTAETMATRLKQRHARLQIAGVWDPGALREGEHSPATLLEAINTNHCDVLWVGLGAPKQELWMLQHRPMLRVPIVVGVGQAFDILAGRTSRAPAWMSSHGMEWLYRLVHEPRRLWKRYLIYNALFGWYLAREACTPTGRKSKQWNNA